MITLSTLIRVTPLKEDTKARLLSALPQMNEDQKFRLSEVCWTTLSTIYLSKWDQMFNRMMKEMAFDKKEYSQNDFEEAKAKLVFEFSQMLESTQTQADIDDVKKQLESHKELPSPPSTQKLPQ